MGSRSTALLLLPDPPPSVELAPARALPRSPRQTPPPDRHPRARAPAAARPRAPPARPGLQNQSFGKINHFQSLGHPHRTSRDYSQRGVLPLTLRRPRLLIVLDRSTDLTNARLPAELVSSCRPSACAASHLPGARWRSCASRASRQLVGHSMDAAINHQSELPEDAAICGLRWLRTSEDYRHTQRHGHMRYGRRAAHVARAASVIINN